VASDDGYQGLPLRATAQRRTWAELPEHVRTLIADRCGSPVVDATSMTSGFTPGFASVLLLADGRHTFVKAAGRDDDRRSGFSIGDAYREEARIRSALSRALPAPRLLWTADDGEWVVNGFEYVAGRLPTRPWVAAELDAVVAALTDMAPALERAPRGLALPTAQDFFSDLDVRIDAVGHRDGRTAWWAAIADLARESPARCAGTAVAHFDVRDDNILLTDDGPVVICDWNWPRLAAPWIDLVGLLVSVHGDGLDADAIIRANPLTRDVEPRSIDAFLAILWFYFTTAADEPAPATSPYLRRFQRLQGEWVLSWLATRGAVRC
jgi:aminoglycoside phosphotransferase (APT) family kinase protein